MVTADSRLILPDPPPALKEHSSRLLERLCARQAEQGFLSFAQYMDMVLYEPGLGYYSAGLHKFGAEGDFVTAPELGKLFATCLARQAEEVAAALCGDPGATWQILEIGAGSGRLAADLLLALQQGDGALPEQYLILERSADLRATQAATLAERVPQLAGRVQWLDAPPQDHWQGLIVANEVLDALAVERFLITGDVVDQLGVEVRDDGLRWDRRPAPSRLGAAVDAVQERLPQALAPGYHSELCLDLAPWLGDVTRTMRRGLALFVDYGYPRSEYYLPARRQGTLVCQYRHRAHFDPFVFPGLQDLSAFVDFTALAEAADAAGLEVAGYSSQAMFLLACDLEAAARSEDEKLGAQYGTRAGLRQRQALAHELRELTLPGAMGEKFQCMGLTRELDIPLRGFELLDLRGRL